MEYAQIKWALGRSGNFCYARTAIEMVPFVICCHIETHEILQYHLPESNIQ